jgi:hypothetical protein
MKYIKPPEIASKIMSLIDEAQDHVIIVSPYNQIANWKKLRNRLTAAIDRKVKIEYYVRADDNHEQREEIRALGIEPIEIDKLHAKLYMNEQSAVVTSMNLYYYSDVNSLDIGFQTDTQDEYDQVMSFYRTYINRSDSFTIQPIRKTDFRSVYRAVGKDPVGVLHAVLSRGLANHVFERSGDRLICENFLMEGVDLIFEPKSSYYRIDFQLTLEKKLRGAVFSGLHSIADRLNVEAGYQLSFGTQMKRIKVDLDTERYDYRRPESWSTGMLQEWFNSELETLLAVFVRSSNTIMPRIAALCNMLE